MREWYDTVCSLCLFVCRYVCSTQDDQRILWEGVSSLTKQELQVSTVLATMACGRPVVVGMREVEQFYTGFGD